MVVKLSARNNIKLKNKDMDKELKKELKVILWSIYISGVFGYLYCQEMFGFMIVLFIFHFSMFSFSVASYINKKIK